MDRLLVLQVVVQYQSECKTKEKHRSGQRRGEGDGEGTGEEGKLILASNLDTALSAGGVAGLGWAGLKLQEFVVIAIA